MSGDYIQRQLADFSDQQLADRIEFLYDLEEKSAHSWGDYEPSSADYDGYPDNPWNFVTDISKELERRSNG